MSSLLGPPELRQTNLKPKTITPSGPSDPFMDLMITNFNNSTKVVNVAQSPQMGYTENHSATYLSSGNPCLDFFYHVVPSTPKESIEQRLHQAWDHDPLTTLKLICNLRGVRGTGKSDKEGFYTAALWLHACHPKNLACNLDSLAQFGYFKDFPEILYRILQGFDVRQIQKSEWNQTKNRGGRSSRRRNAPFSGITSGFRPGGYRGYGARDGYRPYGGRDGYRGYGGRYGYGSSGGRGSGIRNGRGGRKTKPAATRDLRIANAERKNQAEKAKASKERKKKKTSMAKQAFIRFTHDPDYRFLHERVSDLFANYLKNDMELLKSGEKFKISLAAKWCPSLDSSFDKATLLCESIARKLFPRQIDPEYTDLEEAHYAYRIRDRLRKEILVPLRKTLQLPEIYMGARDWGSLPYNRVASVAMKSYKEIFLKHDAERFQKYLEDVKSGEATIAAGALLPHEIIESLNDGDGGQVAELQWKRMVDDMKTKGSLLNCIAVSDVSGSMEGEPMEVSVALGLLVSELAEEPWKGKLITFSANPKLQSVEGDDLKTKTEFIRNMEWGANTDFQRVFDLILRVAVEGNLKPEQMIKRVYVFSDMEFDQASTTTKNGWETDYEMISRKYKEKGFGVPEIVFWNLRDSRATPVHGKEKGVALVSGFSQNLLKVFLEHDGKIDPITILEAVLSGKEYSKLVIANDTKSTQTVNWAKQERPNSSPQVKLNTIEMIPTSNNNLLNHTTTNKFMMLEYLGSAEIN